ncbi:IS6 family transposase [Lactiplantibacillus plantarum]|uniref:IS6 family transposase n=1 Tax=Lactiplantibacillus plantarum TaxID=1590 RepID=UPI003C17F8DE
MNYFKGRHFQQDIIIVAVGYYFRFSLSYRDIVELLRDRGVSVHHTTVMRWVHHYGPIFKALWRQHQTSHTKSWRIDETYINVKGHWTYLYRAIDSNGLTLDFELRKYRDYAAAYHFLKRLLTTNGRPDRLVTDQYRATLKAVKYLMKQDYLSKSAHQCSKYRNNLIEQDHRFIKRHRVRSASFQSIRTASATLSGIEVIHALRKKTRRELSLIGFSAVDELKAMVPA